MGAGARYRLSLPTSRAIGVLQVRIAVIEKGDEKDHHKRECQLRQSKCPALGMRQGKLQGEDEARDTRKAHYRDPERLDYQGRLAGREAASALPRESPRPRGLPPGGSSELELRGRAWRLHRPKGRLFRVRDRIYHSCSINSPYY